MAEERLVAELVQRIQLQLPSARKDPIVGRPQIRADVESEEVQTLVSLATSRLGTIASSLASALLSLGRAAVNSEQATLRQVKSVVIMLEILRRTLGTAVQNKAGALNRPTAEAVLSAATSVWMHPAADASDALKSWYEMRRARATDVIGQLSLLNTAVVMAELSNHVGFLKKANDDNVSTDMLQLIEAMHLNQERLCTVLGLLASNVSTFRKPAQIILARTLHVAIRSWIDGYPAEWAALASSNTRIKHASALFDIMSDWANSDRRKISLWPCMTSLMLLCPNVMAKAANKDTDVRRASASSQAKLALLAALHRHIRGKALSWTAVVCYTDMAKSATFVKGNKDAAVRQVLASVDEELTQRLFDVKRPFSSDDNLVDIDTMTNYAVSMFRLDPEQTLNRILRPMLSTDTPLVFRLVVVRALLALARHPDFAVVRPLAMQVRVLFHALLAHEAGDESKLRQFADKSGFPVDQHILLHILMLYRDDPPFALTPSAEDKEVALSDMKKFITGLVSIVALQPTNVASVQGVSLPEAAMQALLSINREQLMASWYTADPSIGFWEIGAALTSAYGDMLLVSYDVPQTQLLARLDLILAIRRARIAHLNRTEAIRAPGKFSLAERDAAMMRLETAVLTLLPHANLGVATRAIAVIGLLCDEIEIVGRDKSSNSVVVNYDLYRSLGAAVKSSTGRAALQRAIQSVLRGFRVGTTATRQAWALVYTRFRTATSNELEASASTGRTTSKDTLAVGAGAGTDAFSPVSAEWQNLAGFVCAMAGVNSGGQVVVGRKQVLPHEANFRPPQPRHESKPGTGSIRSHGRGNSLGRVRRRQDVDMAIAEAAAATEAAVASLVGQELLSVEQFIEDLMPLTLSKNPYVHEELVRLIGPAMAPSAYPALFTYLQKRVSSFVGDAGAAVQVSEQNTAAVVQTVSIVKSILQQPLANPDDLAMTDFETLLLSLQRYLSHCIHTKETVRARRRFCEMVERLLARHELISFRTEVLFRNTLVSTLMEWLSDYALPKDRRQMARKSQQDRELIMVFNEFDVVCMRTIAAVLHDLPLLGKASERKSDVFLHHFTLLSDVMTRARPATLTATPRKRRTSSQQRGVPPSGLSSAGGTSGAPSTGASSTGKTASSSAGRRSDAAGSSGRRVHSRSLSASLQSPQTNQAVYNQCLIALGTMLQANVGVGLRFLINACFTDHLPTRSAWLTVLTNVLRQGTEFDVLEHAQDRYRELIGLLMEPGMEVIKALLTTVPLAELDPLSEAVIRLFDSQNHCVDLMKKMLDDELKITTTLTTLLRRNSPASKLLSTFTRMVGDEYLIYTLAPAISSIVSQDGADRDDSGGGGGDASAAGAGSKGAGDDDTLGFGHAHGGSNSQIYINAAQRVLDSILSSVPRFPSRLTQLYQHLHVSVKKKFPNARYTVGIMVFLRFYNPAIVTPDGFGLLQSVPSTSARKVLIMVSRILQNLANAANSATPLTVAGPQDTFINDNVDKMRTFFDRILTVDDMVSMSSNASLASMASSVNTMPEATGENADMGLIHRLLRAHLDRLQTELVPTGGRNKKVNRTTFDRLAGVIATLGPAPEPSKPRPDTMMIKARDLHDLFDLTSRSALDEYLAANAAVATKDVEQAKVFYAKGKAKDRSAMLYWIACRFDNTLDLDQLMLLVLRAVSKLGNTSFTLVIDTAQFDHKRNALPASWVLRLKRLLPPTILSSCQRVIIANPSNRFVKWIKGTGASLRPSPSLVGKLMFASSVKDLSSWISPAENSLPPEHLNLDKDVKGMYPSVHKVGRYALDREVTLRVTMTFVSVIRKKEVLYGTEVVLADHIALKDLTSINYLGAKTTSAGGQATSATFILKYAGGTRQVEIRSARADQIVQMIRQHWNVAKSRVSEHHIMRIGGPDQQFSPSDLPGTFLNIALLNMGSSDDALRVAAYRLLVATGAHFNFVIKQQLLEVDGLFVPRSNDKFLLAISEHMARQHASLTIDFIKECVSHYHELTFEMRQHCLVYLAPWLSNLYTWLNPTQRTDVSLNQGKARDVINDLIELTLQEDQLYREALQLIWVTFSYDDRMMDELLDVLISRCVRPGTSQRVQDHVSEMTMMLASKRPDHLGSKVVQRLLRVLKRLSASKSETTLRIDQFSEWPEVAVMIRMLMMLAYDNLLNVQTVLPELWHIVSVVFGAGDVSAREACHTMVINVVHSLATRAIDHEVQREHLRALAVGLSKPKYTQLFVGQARLLRPKADLTEDRPSIQTLCAVIKALSTVVKVCTNPAKPWAADWEQRWLNLALDNAFVQSLPMQPRLLTELAMVHQNVNELTLKKVLAQLNRTITAAVCSSTATSATRSANMYQTHAATACLAKLIPSSPGALSVLYDMFWLGAGLVLLRDSDLFLHAISLMHQVVQKLSATRAFAKDSLPTVMAKQRSKATSAYVAEVEVALSMSYAQSFGFALTSSVLPGLRTPATTQPTLTLCSALVGELMRDDGHSDAVPFLVAMLAHTVGDEHARLRDQVPGQDLSWFWTICSAPDTVRLVALLVAMLEHADYDDEQVFLYEMLLEGLEHQSALPAYSVVHTRLVSRLHVVIAGPQNKAVVPLVLSITSKLLAAAPGSSSIAGSAASKAATAAADQQLGSLGYRGVFSYAPFMSSSAAAAAAVPDASKDVRVSVVKAMSKALSKIAPN